MKKIYSSFKVIVLLGVSAILISCANNTGPVVIRDVTHPPVNTTSSQSTSSTYSVEQNSKSSDQQSTQKNTQSQQSRVQPVAPAQISAAVSSPLKQQLLSNAEQQLSDNNPKAAIISAEKGLRIDRKEPKFYWVLASAYERLADIAQSTYFAQQGLRYAERGSEVYRSLEHFAK